MITVQANVERQRGTHIHSIYHHRAIKILLSLKCVKWLYNPSINSRSRTGRKKNRNELITKFTDPNESSENKTTK